MFQDMIAKRNWESLGKLQMKDACTMIEPTSGFTRVPAPRVEIQSPTAVLASGAECRGQGTLPLFEVPGPVLSVITLPLVAGEIDRPPLVTHRDG